MKCFRCDVLVSYLFSSVTPRCAMGPNRRICGRDRLVDSEESSVFPPTFGFRGNLWDLTVLDLGIFEFSILY